MVKRARKFVSQAIKAAEERMKNWARWNEKSQAKYDKKLQKAKEVAESLRR